MRRLIVLAVFTLPVLIRAQAPEGWLVPFACAFQPDIADFNNAFLQKGLPSAEERHFGWGIELRSGIGGGFLAGPMFFRTYNDGENDRFHLRTEHTGIMAELGYKLPLFKFFTIVPLIGLGGVQPGFHIREKTGAISLDSLLQAPGNTAVLSPGMKITVLGALELHLLIPTNTGSYGLGLRGGYLYSPFRLDWHLANGSRITGTPDSKIQGLWFSVGITLIPAPEVATLE